MQRQKMNHDKIFVIILNWEQEADTGECLDSLNRCGSPDFTVRLIDNGSRDGSPDRLNKRFPGIKIIRNKNNMGFSEGNNIGIREALGNGADYILLLNNDTTVEPDFLRALLESIRDRCDIGIASPKIMFYSDRNRIWFAGGYYLPFIRKPAHCFSRQIDTGQIKEMTETEWVSGCCMLVKREVFEKVGLLDPDYFNNYEDVDFCVRAAKAGYKIVVVPRSKIYHKFAASMGGKFSPFYTYFRTRNNILFFKKTGQWLPLALNFIIFPLYSIFESIRNREFSGIKTTFTAIYDFLTGKYGVGSARELGR